VQVHPTLRCNLRCRHCYSSSAPERAPGLEPRDLFRRLELLRGEGYEVVCFAGGEPLVYPGLAEVVSAARSLGFRVDLVTNGVLLDARRLAALAPSLSLVGVSIDGAPSRHDHLRGQAGAFARVTRCLPLLRAAGVPFGISHCVTQASVRDLPWLAGFAAGEGARLLQLHPLNLVGRARDACPELALWGPDLSRLALVAELLRIQFDDLGIQLDLVRVRDLERIRLSVIPNTENTLGGRVADLVNPLVLDAEGRLWPFAFGMHPRWCLAPAELERWPDALLAARLEAGPRLRGLVASACAAIQRSGGAFADWYGALVTASHAFADSPERRSESRSPAFRTPPPDSFGSRIEAP
jgi:MoaA/NifB/PqqE/SkfB family radical SAM enzyme